MRIAGEKEIRDINSSEPRVISSVREMIIENTVAACMVHDFEEDLVMETIAKRLGTGRGSVFRSFKKVDSALPHELTAQYNLKARLIEAATSTAGLLLAGTPRETIADGMIAHGIFSAADINLAESAVAQVAELSHEDLKKLAAMGEKSVDYLILEIMRAEKQVLSERDKK